MLETSEIHRELDHYRRRDLWLTSRPRRNGGQRSSNGSSTRRKRDCNSNGGTDSIINVSRVAEATVLVVVGNGSSGSGTLSDESNRSDSRNGTASKKTQGKGIDCRRTKTRDAPHFALRSPPIAPRFPVSQLLPRTFSLKTPRSSPPRLLSFARETTPLSRRVEAITSGRVTDE